MMNMKVLEVRQHILDMKRKHGRLTTNFYPGVLSDEDEVSVEKSEKAIVFLAQEANRRRVFFSYSEEESVKTLLQRLPEGVILENVYRKQTDPLENLLKSAGFETYAIYARNTISYHSNPYLIPAKGRRALLQEMYDPSEGEYATEKDAQELYRINRDTFDVLCDDVFTPEQWKKIISNRECMVYRENGKIVSYYVWRLEGRKLYTNLSVNKGAANHLYNMERAVFEQMWEKGIRICYVWYNVENTKALWRIEKDIDLTREAIKAVDTIYNGVYIKR